jgi:hypothetical protein
MPIKSAIKSLPIVGPIVSGFARWLKGKRFGGSTDYWEQRYAEGGNSGAGSYNRLAEFKADFLNEFVARNDVQSVIEFGSGDGAQLELARYPSYVGVDVSRTAIDATRKRFARDRSKRFLHTAEVASDLRAELSLSLDVIYHLVEDATFETHMTSLFSASSRFVVIYASNKDERAAVPHVRHRRFTDWVASRRPDFTLKERVPNAYPFDELDPDNTSFADFYVFECAQPR